jgi:uncharacterized protein (TIGR02391 family)
MPRVISADNLLDSAFDASIPVFLDTTSWREFDGWARQNLPALQNALKGGLRFWIFKNELSLTQPKLYALYQAEQYQEDTEEISEPLTKEDEDADELPSILSFENRMESNLGIKFHEEELPQVDPTLQTFFYEVQEIYFHDISNRERIDRHAEFVFLSRRAARSENKLRVLTAQPAFQRLVNAEIFLIPANPYKSKLPANFDVFTELEIHPKIRQKVEQEFRRGNWSEVIFQAVDAFEAFLQEITGLGTDGGGLVNDVFNPNFDSRRRVAQQFPKLLINDFKLNDNSYVSEVNEQDGYFRYAQGIIKAIRNLGAHNDRNGTFIQSRYGDEKTAIKVLCFLSMICERIDTGKRHSP